MLGTHGRSAGQHDAWASVFGPVGDDGYYKPLYDKVTGAIDPEVAAYWRDHYDLRFIMERDWATLGPKLRGKIHITSGTMDNGYLNNAVYQTEDFFKTSDAVRPTRRSSTASGASTASPATPSTRTTSAAARCISATCRRWPSG